MTWLKARCPRCGNIYDQWHGLATSGSGGITFEGDGYVELGDLLVTDATLICPNPNCDYVLDDVSYTELEAWYQENKVEEKEASQ